MTLDLDLTSSADAATYIVNHCGHEVRQVLHNMELALAKPSHSHLIGEYDRWSLTPVEYGYAVLGLFRAVHSGLAVAPGGTYADVMLNGRRHDLVALIRLGGGEPTGWRGARVGGPRPVKLRAVRE